MSKIIAKYISGDEIALKGCDSILDIQVDVASRNDRLYPEVTVLTKDHKPILDLTALPPSEVSVVLDEAKLADLSNEQWSETIVEYCQRKNPKGVERTIQKFIAKADVNASVRMEILGQALLSISDIEERICMDSVNIIIAEGGDVDFLGPDSETPLQLAAYRGHDDFVEALLDADADVNATNDEEQCALWCAANEGHDSIVNLLLEREDCDVNLQTELGRTPLHEACEQGDVDLVTRLLDMQATVNVADKDGKTPLYVASAEGFAEVVKTLSKKGADLDLDCADKAGKTALMAAAELGHEDAVEALLEAGADIDLENNNGETALDLAMAQCHAGVAVILQD